MAWRLIWSQKDISVGLGMVRAATKEIKSRGLARETFAQLRGQTIFMMDVRLVSPPSIFLPNLMCQYQTVAPTAVLILMFPAISVQYFYFTGSNNRCEDSLF